MELLAATVDIKAKMMLIRRPVPLVPGKKGRFGEQTNVHLKSLLPGLNLRENERKCHEHNQKFRDFQHH